ncbi:MAG: hypothetical protein AB7P78_01325 [Candidatus Binatia bacterium]
MPSLARLGLVVWLLLPVSAGADPVRMRQPECSAHGFLVLEDASGTVRAHGELTQWVERGAIASRLVFHFDDGSLYDELVRFSQRPVFRVLSYRLVQRGGSFKDSSDIQFDRSGKYRASIQKASDEEPETAAGTMEIPEDVSNGIVSILLKNLAPGASATTHLLAFRPEPILLELELRPEGSDEFWVGSSAGKATRFVVTPRVVGIKGVFATATGKQPQAFRMWIAQGRAPVLLRFEGPLYMDGPPWRIEHGAPRWQR